MSANLTVAPPDIAACCLQLHCLLALCAENSGLTTVELQLFQQLWAKIEDLSQSLLPPGPSQKNNGRDNYERPYLIEGCVYLPHNLYFERRFFPEMNAVGYLFSNWNYGPSNLFYYNPEGNFYGSYYAPAEGSDGRRVKIKGVKLSQLALNTYEYPPDTPARERGGRADRYFN